MRIAVIKIYVDKHRFRVYPIQAREKTKVILHELRSCWNWQTGMTKDHVSTDVRVQVSYSAGEWSPEKLFIVFLGFFVSGKALKKRKISL